MIALALAALLAQAQPVAAPDTLPPAPADAYLDAGAREMVRLARERAAAADRSIVAYRVVGRERLEVGVRALSRDRTFFRRELAARVLWRRGGVGRVEVLGARQVTPAIARGVVVPKDAGEEAVGLAFDPTRPLLLQGIIRDDEDGDDELFHPLGPGSERSYRFASGDTTRVRLADGKVIRLAELRVVPRGASRQLLQGSFWLDADTHAPVRASFRFARPLSVSDDPDDRDDEIPRVLQPLEVDMRYITIDYVLVGGRWWLPRLISMEGEGRAGDFLKVPVRFERAYEEYEVEGEETAPLRLAAGDPPADSIPPATADTATGTQVTVRVGNSQGVDVQVRRGCREDEQCAHYTVDQPADSVLLGSDLLADSPYSDEPLISDDELGRLAEALGVGIPGGGVWIRLEVRWSYLNPALVRYNRVEGLALGARADAALGPISADATLWLPTADFQPAGELGVEREGFATMQRLALFRRLAAVDPDPRALGFGSSASALLFGRDDADYFRTLGVELRGAPVGSRSIRYDWRLFAERQTAAAKQTDFSLANLVGDGDFRPNLAADAADQAGVELSAATGGGAEGSGWRWGAAAGVLASAGDFGFVRPTATLSIGFPLPGDFGGALEAAGGTTAGDGPVQSRWYLGGPATVRGYGGGSRIAGPAFWRTRAEVGTALPAARLVLFSDAGWAGETSDLEWDPPLLSAGVGASLLDGLVRLDLARALRGDRGWRLDLHLDAVF